MYKISLSDMRDNGEYGWETMIVKLCTKGDPTAGDTINTNDYTDIQKLYKAPYTGVYYLKFWNGIDTSYSFSINEYYVIGKTVIDSDNDTYKITSNYNAELQNVASKNKSEYYFNDEIKLTQIDGIEVLDEYDTTYRVTSIGTNAFKGCKITNISIPDTVKRIKSGAFRNCKKLGSARYYTGVIIEGKKVVIEKNAFIGCKRLGSIRIPKSASVKSVQKNAFKGTKKGIQVEVPSVKKYKKIFKRAGFKKPKYSKTYY